LVPSYLTYRKTGSSPFMFSKEDTVINYVGRIYRYISLSSFVTVILNALFPKVMVFLIPIQCIENPYIFWTGMVLLHLSLLWIFIAQRNMKDEWRIGIDKRDKITLVTNGLFSKTRNPIFLGVIFVFFGLVMVIPNIVTFTILVAGVIVIQIQVRLEEEFLLKELGFEYQQYMKRINRWIFQ